MRTTLDLPEGLLEEARHAINAPTKREAVIAGLREILKRKDREELRSLAGRVKLEIDLTRSRKR